VKRHLSRLVPAALAFCFVLPVASEAQIQTSIGAGIAVPTGDFGDVADNGYTVRGQLGVSLLLASVHAQVGWTRFPGPEIAGIEADDADIWHAGVGGRFGLGLFWVGLNAAYFGGDGEDDGLGFFPEVGLGLGPLEAVADYRIDGDAKWLGLRAALKF
jgi:hypothetical protein